MLPWYFLFVTSSRQLPRTTGPSAQSGRVHLIVGVNQSRPLGAGSWSSVSLRRGLINYCATIPTILTVIGSPGVSPILVS